jgi:hypothetical protein
MRRVKDDKKVTEAVRQEDLIKGIKRALRADLEVDEVEYEGESTYGRGYRFEGDRASNGESEWCVFTSMDDAENEAREMVEEDLMEEPSLFNKDWIQNFLYISDADKRIIAGDEADFMVEDLDADEVFERLGDTTLQSNYESAMESEDFVEAQKTLESAREKLQERIYEEMKINLDTPIKYFVEEQGVYTMDELMNQPFMQIDYKEAAQNAVQTDGIAHFLDRYDGEEEEITDPQTSDKFYVFGTN